MVFDHGGTPISSAYREHTQIYPQPGWVEHDPEQIWRNTLTVMGEALSRAQMHLDDLVAIGVTNQRETTVIWDAATGKPLHNAIVWQDRRTAPRCSELAAQGLADPVRDKTGLPLDPYFSATKVEWLLRHCRKEAKGRKILFGNIDTWLIWKLTGEHVTDATNASRTMLFNLDTLEWDAELLELFRVPRGVLPTVKTSSELYGTLGPNVCRELPGGPKRRAKVPVTGDLGDQQAALFGQAGFAPGEIKNTYGTGSFLLQNVGTVRMPPEAGLLSTIAFSLPGPGVAYALEGSVFITG
ncbi:MAG: glycerol kinase, partial [Planctomycetes bacterium]|nr:glycerol kinase [Planctomycetota bacterium]